MRKKIEKNRDIILLTIGSMLVVLSICLLFYDRIEVLKSNVFDEIAMEKYRENTKDVEKIDDESEINVDAETNEIDDETQETKENTNNSNTNNNSKTNTNTNTIKKEYIGYLEIKKVNLKQGLVSKNSYYNNVDRNIQILSASDYPDKEKGNVILAAHSGSGYISFFKNLYKLSVNDEATIYYKNYVYTYKIVKIYNVPKTGMVAISRDVKKSCLTLITCTHGSKTQQTVYILELASKTKESGK